MISYSTISLPINFHNHKNIKTGCNNWVVGEMRYKEDKSHDTINVKAKTERGYHGISSGKMSALQKRQGNEERNIQKRQTAFSLL
jgi:hypothetical protein